MKYNDETLKKIEKDCQLCRNSFMVWVSNFNFEKNRDENIRSHLRNYCSSCRILDKIKKKAS